MFNNCHSLIYLNLYSFQLNNTVNKTTIFYKISSYVRICIFNINTQNFLLENGKISICSDPCFNDKNEIMINNECINICNKKGF